MSEQQTIQDIKDYFEMTDRLEDEYINQMARQLLSRLERAYIQGSGNQFFQTLADNIGSNIKLI